MSSDREAAVLPPEMEGPPANWDTCMECQKAYDGGVWDSGEGWRRHRDWVIHMSRVTCKLIGRTCVQCNDSKKAEAKEGVQ